jgi:hypothetical protein
VGSSKQIPNTKYQIPKPNTREIGEFPLVKLPQTTPKNLHHTKAKKLHHKSKEATLLPQSSPLSAETKIKELSNKYLMYLLLKPKSHRTSSSTQSNMQYHVSPHMGGPLGQSLHLCGRTLGPKPPNSLWYCLFIKFQYILLGRLGICFLVN